MYFVIRCHFDKNSISYTDKCTVGCFSSLRKAKKYVLALSINYDRDTVIIVFIPKGPKDCAFPEEVYEWNEYYWYYIPVSKNDIRRKMTITY